MRVTESLIFKRITTDHAKARQRLDQVSRQLMTGQKMERPSDDPLATQRLARNQRELASTERFKNNIGRAETYHQIVDTTIGSVVGVLEEMTVVAIQMANDSQDASARKAAAASVTQLLDQLEALANSKHDGRYLFAGRTQDKPAYVDGVFQGDPVGRKIPIGDGVEIAGDTPGPGIFGAAGLNAFAAAKDLIAALNADDGDAIAVALDSLNASHETAVGAHTKVGHTLSELSAMELVHDDKKFIYEKQQANLLGVDVAKAASELAFAETVYQSSIDTARQIVRMLNLETQL